MLGHPESGDERFVLLEFDGEAGEMRSERFHEVLEG